MNMSYYDFAFILIVLVSISSQISHLRSNEGNECEPVVQFSNCKSSAKKPIILYNTIWYQITVNIAKGCERSDISTFWTLWNEDRKEVVANFPRRKNKEVISIMKYQLELGRYILAVHVTETPNFKLDVEVKAKCYIKMTADCPVPVIGNAVALKTVPLEDNVVLRANAIKCNLQVSYIWRCVSQTPYESCTALNGQKGENVTLPIIGRIGEEITVTLIAMAPMTRRRSVRQTLVVNNRNTPLISIICKKNCISTGAIYANPVVPIHLFATCLTRCYVIKRYKWKIEAVLPVGRPVEEIMENGTLSGVNTEQLIIKAKQFNYEEIYAITLFVYNEVEIVARAMIYINMAQNLTGKSQCTAKHNEKEGILRTYNIECDVPKGFRPATYKLHHVYTEPGSNQPMTYGVADNHLPQFNVKLAQQGDFDFQILWFVAVDDTMVITYTMIMLEVPRLFTHESDDEILAKMKNIYLGQSGTIPVKLLLKLGRTEEAAQIIIMLLSEANKIYRNNPISRNIVRATQAEIMSDLLAYDKTIADFEHILPIISHMVPENPKKILHSKLRSRLCMMIASHLVEYIHKEEYPLCYQGFLETLTIPLLKCANVYLDDKYEEYTSFHIPLPEPIPEHRPIIESYPNYGDIIDEATAEDFREIISNAMFIINAAGEAYSKTFTIGEPRVYLGYTANTTIDIEYAEAENKTQYSDGNVHVILPKSLGLGKDDIVRVVYTTIPSSAFFWDRRTGNISDFVLNVNIYGPKRRSSKPKRPPKRMQLFFKLSEKQRITILDGELSVSLEGSAWNDDYVEKNMKLLRVEVSNLDNLVSLVALARPISLMIAITKFRKPTKNDFVLAAGPNKPFYLAFNRTETDALYYMGLLPNITELIDVVKRKRRNTGPDYDVMYNDDYTVSFNSLKAEKLKITYKYAFAAMSCREWDGDLWAAHNCDINFQSGYSAIKCTCRNVSSIVADMKNVRVTEERTMNIDYALNITVNPVIPSMAGVIFGIYCILVCFIYFRRRSENVFFLCDNLEDDRYAYLIKIHTGPYSNSGTTSKMTIKLSGEKANSKPHVLNYPDPDYRIFQEGGEDYFILTTRYYLGDIYEMELWYDAVGRCFTWFCEYVEIFDLQTQRKWFFRVCQRFTVLVPDKHHYTFEPSAEVGWNVKRRLHNYFYFHSLSYNFLNVFKRRQDLSISYFQRISILACKLLSAGAISLAVVSRPSFELKDGLGQNNFDCWAYVLVNSVAIGTVVFSVYIPLTIIFRYTRQKEIFFKEKEPALSYKVELLCWTFIAVSMSCSLAYLFYFGFWISSIECAMCAVIATLASIFDCTLLENLSTSIYQWIISWRVRRKPDNYRLNFNKILIEAERQRKYLYNKLGRYALRPLLGRFYKPLSREKYSELNKRKTIEYKITNSASDMAFFYLYATLLFWLLVLKLNVMTYVSSKHMMDMTLHGSAHTYPVAEDVTSFEDLYEYLNNTLAAVLHPMEWYGRWKVSESGLLADYNTKIIGVVRIRQKRVRESYCPIPFFAKSFKIACYPEYSSGKHDQSDIGLSESIWSFQNIEADNRQDGEIDAYSGRGFIVKLGRNLNNTYYMIKLMKDANWFSPKTRAVFIEFWTYNANQNLFNAITILFERSATQLMILTHRITTLELMHTTKTQDILTVVIYTIFCVLTFNSILRYIRRLLRHGLTLLLKLANFWEVINILMNIAIVVLYMLQFDEHIRVFFKVADSKSNEFISYFKIMRNYRSIRLVASGLFALAIVRGITFTRFISVFKVFEKVLVLSFGSFCGVIMLNFIVTLCFAHSGYLLFGRYSHNFRNFEESFYTLVRGGMGLHRAFSQSVLANYNKKIGYAFYTIYSINVVFIKTIFIVTAMIFYQRSKRALSRLQSSYTFTQFVSDRWRYYKQLFKRRFWRSRLKGGKDSIKFGLIATPKDDHFRYENCMFIPHDKLQYMRLVAKAAVRRMYTERDAGAPPAEEDFDLMREIAAALFAKGDRSKSMFFRCKDRSGNVKIVSNSVLLEMEYWANHVLTHSRQMGQTSSNLTDTSSLKKMEEIENVVTSINAFIGSASSDISEKSKML